MRLIKLKLENFRRFIGEHSLDLNESLIALVGANESGKSSLLDAIQIIGGATTLQESDVSRGVEGGSTLSGLYILSEDERISIRGIHDGDKVTHIWKIIRSDEDHALWRPWPYPCRDLKHRKNALKYLEKIERDPALKEHNTSNANLQWDHQLLEHSKEILSSRKDCLSQEEINALTDLSKRIRAIRENLKGDPKNDEATVRSNEYAIPSGEARKKAAIAVIEAAQFEASDAPAQDVINKLGRRDPDVAWFSDVDRELDRQYQFTKILNNPPNSLSNLCELAGIDLEAVAHAYEHDRIPQMEKIFEDGNKVLKEKFNSTWRQSKVYPRLSPPLEGTLRVFVATEGEAGYSFPEERSDGLRWFMALHAFLVSQGKDNPILLVDEAETHLHYDAQADLVDALMNQEIAEQVIYTTHSVGCLPPDLGKGIRAVLIDKEYERSRIENSYWSVDVERGEKIGYSPLLFAMGAELLAFTVPRFGVITEGPSDAVLLPRLLRSATGLERLPYRVVPGLSELATERINSINQAAAKVLCLTDDDAGGRKLRKEISKAGIPAEKILHLGQIVEGGTLEDLVAEEAFVDAVNEEIASWGLGDRKLEVKKIPDTGRWKWLMEKWTRGEVKVGSLGKVRVAQRLVDWHARGSEDGKGENLVPSCYLELLRSLHEDIIEQLES